MTVEELIEKLKQMPQDAKIVLTDGDEASEVILLWNGHVKIGQVSNSPFSNYSEFKLP